MFEEKKKKWGCRKKLIFYKFSRLVLGYIHGHLDITFSRCPILQIEFVRGHFLINFFHIQMKEK
jgi:hypothetical protein